MMTADILYLMHANKRYCPPESEEDEEGDERSQVLGGCG
jgi:hypothetical protein